MGIAAIYHKRPVSSSIRVLNEKGEKKMTRLISVNATARILGINPLTVRRHLKRGNLRFVRLGRRIRIPENEVARAIAEGIKASSVPSSKEKEAESGSLK